MEEDIVREVSAQPLDPSRPLYDQFVERIRAAVTRSRIPPGARLPSVRELAARIRVNPTTIQRTYQELERERLIVSFRGQGTFVTKDSEVIAACRRRMARAALDRLEETAKSLGLTIPELMDLARSGEEENDE